MSAVRFIFLLVAYLLTFTQADAAEFFESTVRFVNGPDAALMDKLDARFGRILTACSRGDMERCREYFTTEGYEAMLALQRQRPFINSEKLYRPQFIEHGDEYEARGFRVLADATEGRQALYLVFHLDSGGWITDVNFGMGPEGYRELFRAGQGIRDTVACLAIKQYVDLLIHAYCVRDIDYISQAYSEDALIVVGRKLVKCAEPNSDGQRIVSLPRDKYEFVRRSKREYIERLAETFARNEYVTVEHHEVKIGQHERFPNIFGVHLFQRWTSSTYSDEGYLFLAIRRTEAQTVIEMRSWQPQPFDDGSVVGLKDVLFLPPPDDNTLRR